MNIMLFVFSLVQLSTERGTIREISTSKIKNNTPIKRNWNENGGVVSIFEFIPHSNGVSSIGFLYDLEVILVRDHNINENNLALAAMVNNLFTPYYLIGNKIKIGIIFLINRLLNKEKVRQRLQNVNIKLHIQSLCFEQQCF